MGVKNYFTENEESKKSPREVKKVRFTDDTENFESNARKPKRIGLSTEEAVKLSLKRKEKKATEIKVKLMQN